MISQNKKYLIYIIIIFILLLTPFAGMLFYRGSNIEDAEKRDLAQLPGLYREDGSFNVDILSGYGTYFEDHYAFRPNYVTADHLLFTTLLGSSVNDEVIVGSDGWLFYHGTVGDYLGKSLLSERERYICGHNLLLIQEYVQDGGADFLFVIAPNKNSIYGEYMPYNYIKSDQSNAQSLLKDLESAGVKTADVYEELQSGGEDLYLPRDSHWSNKGAYIAYKEICAALGREPIVIEDTEWIAAEGDRGDLDEMFFPLYPRYEDQYVSDKMREYQVLNDAEDGMSPRIVTYSPDGSGNLFMFRDSFGASLVLFLAPDFENATFSRYVPYDLPAAAASGADCIIIETVERNLIDLAARTAILPASPIKTIEDYKDRDTNSSMTIDEDGAYRVIKGSVDPEYITANTDIYINVVKGTGTETYAASYTTNEQRQGNGYCLYLYEDALKECSQIELIVCTDDVCYNVYAMPI